MLIDQPTGLIEDTPKPRTPQNVLNQEAQLLWLFFRMQSG